MNWYSGNISEAVTESKVKNAIFVVYVEGKDETSQKMSRFINDERICCKLQSDHFVAIKIESDSESYMQFAAIYQVVPVPSIFFIGKSGAPLDIGTGIIANIDELEQKIDKVLIAVGKGAQSSIGSVSSTFIRTEQQTADTTVSGNQELPTSSAIKITQIENKEQLQPETTASEVEGEPTNLLSAKSEQQQATKEVEVEANVDETRRKLEIKRRERIAEESRLEKERELKRRKEGKEMLEFESLQKEQELKNLKENIRRERLAEHEARERIRAQIAGDRAERAKKDNVETEACTAATTSSAAVNTTTQRPTNSTDEARLQFRLPGGSLSTRAFNCQELLSVVRLFVRNELLEGTGMREFSLATSYPKREFSSADDEKTLVELNLFPNAVILVLGRESSSNPIVRSAGLVNIFTTVFWVLVRPIVALFDYFRTTSIRRSDDGAHKRANEELLNVQADAAKRRNLDRFMQATSQPQEINNEDQSRAYRRYGESNVHRLQDNTKDSDDENATWNGNSTQQQ